MSSNESVICTSNIKIKYTPAVRSKILSKLIFASCVWHSDRAYYGLCVLIKDIGRRLPLELLCSYQGEQGDVSQPVRGNYKTRFWGGQNLTAVEGNASVYHVNPLSRITGEGRAEFLRTWGPGSDQEGAGGGSGGVDGRGNSICSLKLEILWGDKSDGFGNNARVYHVYPVSYTTSEERAECSGVGATGFFHSFRSHRRRGWLYAWC